MDDSDRKLADLLQHNSRLSNADLGMAVGMSVSTTNDRVRRLDKNGSIQGWHAKLDPAAVGAGLCVFVLIDMQYDGEDAACATLLGHDEVQELHHVSGPHSYLMKLRVQDTGALQQFLAQTVKPLSAITRTETLIALDSLKETSAVKINPPS